MQIEMPPRNPLWGERVKRLSGISMLSCAFASAMLLSQNTVAQNEGAAAVTDPYAALDALINEDEEGRAKAKASKGEEAPSCAVDEETLSLYPTAAQCGECHQQIYEEWSSSQHAYASISPMFHKFEQKFQEMTQGTVGTFCVRCHQQVGTQLGEARDTPLWARSKISAEGVTDFERRSNTSPPPSGALGKTATPAESRRPSSPPAPSATPWSWPTSSTAAAKIA